MRSTDRKKPILILLVLLMLSTALVAKPAGITFKTWMPSKSIGGGEGIHASVGGFVAPHPRLELEVSAIVGLTPKFANHLYGALHISTGVAAPLYYRSGEATLYYNGLVGATLLGGYDIARKQYTAAVGVRIIPLTIGGAHYGRRERAVEVSVLYDLMQNKWSLVWSLLGYDIYLRSSSS